ncbi:thiolase domain-containing protein [Haloquadratum walsbyi]|uniref:Acetyl-CoA acetyltransferase n=1 Tax=Haloquadratum walsbyi J07HQW2 TaxID=1238425 RepID=U1MVN6_9EURY|nr:thiolase domain-containing protein [Haloquadratum walsbyi]ERG94459.1 MAG: acetyl-CoA acetyltransferase [Haloquadratum walsbyi J07HQW2]
MGHPQVAGVGLTHFGKHPERTTRDMFAEAGLTALDDAGVDSDDIESVFYGNFIGEVSEDQGHMGPISAEALGIDAPATRIESACASSGVAVREAVKNVRSGESDAVIVGGAERMNNLGTAETTASLALAADDLYEVRVGMTFPGAYALMADAYFEEYGGSREDLAYIAQKNHANAVDNEFAQFQYEIDIDDALDAPPVAEPLHLYDACPVTDGAAAAVIVSEEYAANNNLDIDVRVTGSGQGSDNLALQDREYLTQTPAATNAANEAFDDATIGPADVDLAEVHDCFTIAEVLALESMGIFDHGDGINAARRGDTLPEGDIPVNLSGGLKAKGHPVGATGAAQIAEMTRLLRGDHHNSEYVSDSSVGITHNAGGTVASTVVHVLEVDQ